MSKLTYLKGNATNPTEVSGKKLLIHCCNDRGGWGSGFVLAISARWSSPERDYREWHKDNETFKLGNIRVIPVESDMSVVNMIGQRSTGMQIIAVGKKDVTMPPIRYEAIEECLFKVAAEALKIGASVVCPRFGSGLAGGDWLKIEALIKKCLVDNGVDVYVYDFVPKS